MYWIATRSIVVSFPRWCSLALLLRSPARRYGAFRPLLTLTHSSRRLEQICCFKNQKNLRGSSKTTKKSKASTDALNDKDLSHLLWWKERLEMCRKPSTVQILKRLTYSNLLGLDVNLKNGSLKEGTLNWEMLQFKSRFPREVLLCRVGDFYEAIGIDACILVEYAGLNPFGGLRSDSVPRAGCPVIVLYFLPSIIYLAFLSQFLLSIMGAVQDISILCCYILVNRIILCLSFFCLVDHLLGAFSFLAL